MTQIEQRAVKSLLEVKLPLDTWHGKFIRRTSLRMAADPLWPLTAHEQHDLWYLVWRYRRQIADVEVLAQADEVVNGALSLRFS